MPRLKPLVVRPTKSDEAVLDAAAFERLRLAILKMVQVVMVHKPLGDVPGDDWIRDVPPVARCLVEADAVGLDVAHIPKP